MRRCLELVFLLTTLLLTSCSGSSEKKYDLIAADPEWTSTVTFGKAPNLQGFTFDLVTAIAQSQKLSIKLFDTTTDRLIPDLDRNLYVASLSTLSTTE